MAMAMTVLFIITAIILLLIIPVTIGIFVYRDARRRGMNAPLWALAAALMPTFIGLIIYLIVSSLHSAKSCGKCGGGVGNSAVCPHCGAKLRMNCPTCAYPLEPEWTVCPKCGSRISDELRQPLTVESSAEKVSDKKVGLIIGLIVAIPVLLCILLIVMLSLFGIRSSQSTADYGECTVESFEDKDYIQSWIDECDEKGKGIYILYDGTDKDSKNHSMSYVAYNNTENVTANWQFESGGFFDRSGNVTLKYVNSGDNDRGYSLSSYVVSSTGRIKDIEIFDQNGEVVKNADIRTAEIPLCEYMCMENGFSVSFEDIPDIDKTRIAVEISGQDTGIYSLTATQYDLQGNAFGTQGVANADGTCLNGREMFEFVRGLDGGEMSYIVFEACDEDGALVADSDNIVCGYGEQFKLSLERGANQQWQFVYSDEPYVENKEKSEQKSEFEDKVTLSINVSAPYVYYIEAERLDADGKLIDSFGYSAAEGECVYGTESIDFAKGDDESAVACFVVTAFGADEKEIAKSDMVTCAYGKSLQFSLESDENGSPVFID